MKVTINCYNVKTKSRPVFLAAGSFVITFNNARNINKVPARKGAAMKKTLAAAAALLTISSSAFAAMPTGVFTSQQPTGPSSHVSHMSSSRRIHVDPLRRMHTPTGNRVRMTPAHGQTGPVGGRMSSMPHSCRHVGPSSATVHVGRSSVSMSGSRYSRNYVRPSLVSRYRYCPLPPPRWRYAGYYSGHYWHPYRFRSVWYRYPTACYGYPIVRHGYPVFFRGGWYARPGVHISIRI